MQSTCAKLFAQTFGSQIVKTYIVHNTAYLLATTIGDSSLTFDIFEHLDFIYIADCANNSDSGNVSFSFFRKHL